jgi:hypothetical protein
MMSSIYVGGSYESCKKIQEIQAAVQKQGFIISYDWTKDAEKVIAHRTKNKEIIGEGSILDSFRTVEDMQKDAVNDFDGVYRAEWSIFLFTEVEYVYRGTFFELGASIMRDALRNHVKKTIIISNPNSPIYANTLCFFHHPNIIHVKTIEEALARIAM